MHQHGTDEQLYFTNLYKKYFHNVPLPLCRLPVLVQSRPDVVLVENIIMAVSGHCVKDFRKSNKEVINTSIEGSEKKHVSFRYRY